MLNRYMGLLVVVALASGGCMSNMVGGDSSELDANTNTGVVQIPTSFQQMAPGLINEVDPLTIPDVLTNAPLGNGIDIPVSESAARLENGLGAQAVAIPDALMNAPLANGYVTPSAVTGPDSAVTQNQDLADAPVGNGYADDWTYVPDVLEPSNINAQTQEFYLNVARLFAGENWGPQAAPAELSGLQNLNGSIDYQGYVQGNPSYSEAYPYAP